MNWTNTLGVEILYGELTLMLTALVVPLFRRNSPFVIDSAGQLYSVRLPALIVFHYQSVIFQF